MPNIVYFEIPANNIDRAKHFYHALLGWKIEPTKVPMDQAAAAAMQYHDISTGEAQEGTLTMGGLYKRQMSELIINHVAVEDIDKVLGKVEQAWREDHDAENGNKICRPECDHPGYRRKLHWAHSAGDEVIQVCRIFDLFSEC